MKHASKRFFALIMAMAMCLSMVQGAFAAEAATSHTFEYVEGNVEWNKTNTGATMTFTCKDHDGVTKTVDAVVAESTSTKDGYKAATCTEDGVKVLVATATLPNNTQKGNQWSGEAVEAKAVKTIAGDKALGHKWDDGVVTPPTCTEAGYTTFTCKNDKKHTTTIDPTTKKDTTVKAAGHKLHYSIVNEGDIKANSYQVETWCENCDLEEMSPVMYAEQKSEPATCEKDGYIYYYAEYKVDGKVVASDDWGWKKVTDAVNGKHDNWIKGAKVEPTCTENGYTPYTCKDCGEVEKRDFVPAYGHSYLTPVEENVVEATCEKDGSYDLVTYCAHCGKVAEKVEKNVIRKLGHKLDEKAEASVVKATCKKEGYTFKTCTVCGKEVKLSTLPKDSENHSDRRESVSNITEATIDKDGSRTVVYSCADCGMTSNKVTETIHYFGNAEEVVSTKSVTYDSVKKTYVANSCKVYEDEKQTKAVEYYYETAKKCIHDDTLSTETEKHTVAPKAHTPVEVKGEAPTKYSKGKTDGTKCKECGEWIVKQEEIPTLIDTPSVWNVEDVAFNADAKGVSRATIYYISADKKYNHTETKAAEAETVAATCKDKGYTVYFVTDMKGEKHYFDKKFDETAVLAHTEVEIPATATTTAGKKCSVCDTIIEAPAKIVEKEVEKEVEKVVEVEKPIVKKAQNISVVASKSTFSYKTLKKKTLSTPLSINNAHGKITVVTNYTSKIYYKNGKLYVKKGAKKGTYRVRVKAAGTTYYKNGFKVITIKIK